MPAGLPVDGGVARRLITITSGATGSGDNFVRYNVAANTTGQQRTGTIRIQGMTYTVVQAP